MYVYVSMYVCVCVKRHVTKRVCVDTIIVSFLGVTVYLSMHSNETISNLGNLSITTEISTYNLTLKNTKRWEP